MIRKNAAKRNARRPRARVGCRPKPPGHGMSDKKLLRHLDRTLGFVRGWSEQLAREYLTAYMSR